MTLTLTGLNASFEPFSESEREDVQLADGEYSPVDFKRNVSEWSPAERQFMWRIWMSQLFSHSTEPCQIFDTGTVTKKGIDFTVVRRMKYGPNRRMVLKRHPDFIDLCHTVGKAICLQFAVDSSVEPEVMARQIPFDIEPFEIVRLQEYVSEKGSVWADFRSLNRLSKVPISTDLSLSGMLYMMYSIDSSGSIVPRYIGISQKSGSEGNLNWNFANIKRDSVFGRWGYGRSQHLGELSRVICSEKDGKAKYQRWGDELFMDRSPVLKQNLYIEMLPWFDSDLVSSEANLINLASTLFGDKVLNVVHSSKPLY